MTSATLVQIATYRIGEMAVAAGVLLFVWGIKWDGRHWWRRWFREADEQVASPRVREIVERHFHHVDPASEQIKFGDSGEAQIVRAPTRDKSLIEGALYAVMGQWGLAGGAGNFEPDPSVPRTAGDRIVDWIPDFEQRARDGDVTVWGRSRESSTAPLAPIDSTHWHSHTVDFLATVMGEPRSRRRGDLSAEGGYENLMVSSAQFEKEWPHAG